MTGPAEAAALTKRSLRLSLGLPGPTYAGRSRIAGVAVLHAATGR